MKMDATPTERYIIHSPSRETILSPIIFYSMSEIITSNISQIIIRPAIHRKVLALVSQARYLMNRIGTQKGAMFRLEHKSLRIGSHGRHLGDVKLQSTHRLEHKNTKISLVLICKDCFPAKRLFSLGRRTRHTPVKPWRLGALESFLG